MIRLAITILLVAPLADASAATLLAEDKRPSLDDELMRQLGVEPVEGVAGERFGPEKPEATSPKEAEELRRKLARELGTAAISEDDNPLLSIAQQMREVEGLIARAESGTPTQRAQDRIVAELDKLIEQARKNRSDSPSRSTNSQTNQASAPREKVSQPTSKPGTPPNAPSKKPAATSNAPPGEAKVEKAQVGQIRAMIEKQLWGSLPERQRQQLLQLPMEEFLPKYEPLIIEYFKRLSEAQDREGRNNGRL